MKPRSKLKAAITRYVNASIEDANKGCQPPEDWPAYEEDLENARTWLEKAIDRFEKEVAALPTPTARSIATITRASPEHMHDLGRMFIRIGGQLCLGRLVYRDGGITLGNSHDIAHDLGPRPVDLGISGVEVNGNIRFDVREGEELNEHFVKALGKVFLDACEANHKTIKRDIDFPIRAVLKELFK